MDTPNRRHVTMGIAATALAACAPDTTEMKPAGNFLDLNGRKLHYVQEGSGPDLVLIHGASGNLLDWTYSLLPRLRKRYRVFAMDRPGLGYSDPAPDELTLASQAHVIHAAARKLGLKRPVVVGHSYGGSVALSYAVRHSTDVSGLLLLAAPSHEWPGSAGRLYDIANTPVLGPLMSALLPVLATDGRVRRAVTGIFAPQPVPPGYLDHVRPDLALRPATFRRNTAQVGTLKAQLRALAPAYPDLPMPVELIHGTADETVSLTIHSAQFANRHPRSRLTRLNGVGHMPHHASPDAVEAALARLHS